jgi:large subunit ribosomal protein L21
MEIAGTAAKRSWRQGMKYAILESGGKQYIAREGESIEVDRLPVEIGKSVDFKDVLLLVETAKVHVGSPHVKGAKVRGTVVEQLRSRKVIVFKYIPKERYRRKLGHRQRYTRVTIDKITLTTPRKTTTTTEAGTRPEEKTPPSEAKVRATKATGSKEPQATKTTSAKKSTSTKTSVRSKAKDAQSKGSAKAKSSKASTKTKDKATDKK